MRRSILICTRIDPRERQQWAKCRTSQYTLHNSLKFKCSFIRFVIIAVVGAVAIAVTQLPLPQPLSLQILSRTMLRISTIDLGKFRLHNSCHSHNKLQTCVDFIILNRKMQTHVVALAEFHFRCNQLSVQIFVIICIFAMAFFLKDFVGNFVTNCLKRKSVFFQKEREGRNKQGKPC